MCLRDERALPDLVPNRSTCTPTADDDPCRYGYNTRMTFHIYENWRAGTHKAVVHHATCPFCNHGQGLRGGTDPENGRWHGPYASLDEARHAQQQFRVDQRTEHHCVSR